MEYEVLDLDAVMKGQRSLTPQMTAESDKSLDSPALENQDHPAGPEAGQEAADLDEADHKADEEIPDPEKGEEEGGADKAPENSDSSSDQPQPRFKSHEEAEKGYRELRAKATKAEQELAQIRAAEKAAAEKDAAEKAGQDLEEKAAEAYLATMQEADAEDPEDPDYHNKVARIWGRHHAKMAQLGLSHAPEPASSAPEETRPEPEPEPVTPERVEKMAAERGLSEDDLVIFRGLAGKVPAVSIDGRALSLSEQVDLGVKMTKEYVGKRTRLAPQPGPMGRNGMGRPPASSVKNGGEQESEPLIGIEGALKKTTKRL